MQVGRRRVLKLLGSAAVAAGVGARLGHGVARALDPSEVLGLRSVQPEDAPALQAIMTSCVNDASAFFGQCGEWPLAWAQDFITRSPLSPVLTHSGEAMAFFEVRPLPPLAVTASNGAPASAEAVAFRDRARRTLRVRVAGVRFDALAPDAAVRMFQTALYVGFRAASAAGYDTVEAWAPWEQHPFLQKKWTDYAGCTLVEPVAQEVGGTRQVYVLRWGLAEAIAALAAEDRYDVA
jgi:hypothetical protein